MSPKRREGSVPGWSKKALTMGGEQDELVQQKEETIVFQGRVYVG
jgi:hypothetical protein